MRVLIVEDEATIAQRVSRLLRDILGEQLESLEVIESFDLAMESLAMNPVDLLTLDLNLDGDDGFALLETAAAETFHTIVISAHTERALEAFEHGVLDFLFRDASFVKVFPAKVEFSFLSQVVTRSIPGERSICNRSK